MRVPVKEGTEKCQNINLRLNCSYSDTHTQIEMMVILMMAMMFLLLLRYFGCCHFFSLPLRCWHIAQHLWKVCWCCPEKNLNEERPKITRLCHKVSHQEFIYQEKTSKQYQSSYVCMYISQHIVKYMKSCCHLDYIIIIITIIRSGGGGCRW